MKKRTLLTPIDLSAATKVGKRTFLKQVLPIGSINYKGRRIEFSREYLTDLATAFKSGAYDQVPLVFADHENRHNLDPKRFGGEIEDFVVKNDGLYAKVSATSDTAKVLKNNPRLGVSARIVEGLEKSDGRVFPRAIQHVLLTMDPRVTGMKPWQTIDLSGYDGATNRVVDLTALTFEKGTAMPKIRKGGSTDVKARKAETAEPQPDANGILDLSNLTDEQLDILLSATTAEAPAKTKRRRADATDSVEDVDPDEIDEEDEDEEDPDLDPEDFEDEEPDEDEDEENDESDDDSDEEDEPNAPNALAQAIEAEKARRTTKPKAKKGRKDLSSHKDAKRQIDLAADTVDSTLREDISQMQIDLAEERWSNQRKEYVRSGVPPFLLDLAAPVLSSPEAAVIDLSNADEPVNATETIRQMLDGVKGLVDLRPEIGHRIDLSADQDDTSRDDILLKQWDQEYGVR